MKAMTRAQQVRYRRHLAARSRRPINLVNILLALGIIIVLLLVSAGLVNAQVGQPGTPHPQPLFNTYLPLVVVPHIDCPLDLPAPSCEQNPVLCHCPMAPLPPPLPRP